MSDTVTIKTGGVTVGRKHRRFDLDCVSLCIDLIGRGYTVFIRGGEHDHHLVQLDLIDDVFRMQFTIHSHLVAPNWIAAYGVPDYWVQLDSHLHRLLARDLYDNRITNYPLEQKESECPTPSSV